MTEESMAYNHFPRSCQSKLSTLLCLLILTVLSTEVLGAEFKLLPSPRKSPRSPPSRPPPKSRSLPSPPPKGASTSPLSRKPPPVSKPPPPSPPSPRPPPRPRSPPPPPHVRLRDGIRLVGSTTKGIGRVEFRQPEYRIELETEWVPVCGSIPEGNLPELLCNLLGFRYGRPYYEEKLNKEVYYGLFVLPSLAGCGPNAPNNTDTYFKQVGKYKCWFYREYERCGNGAAGNVAGFNDLAALQCSDTILPPAPPPNPYPPPPPPRIEQQANIRLVPTGRELGSYPDGTYRVELRVYNSVDGRVGAPVWAPLCTPAQKYDKDTDIALGKTICTQALADWITDDNLWCLSGHSHKPLPISPQEDTYSDYDPGFLGFGRKADGLNPSNYSHWVTVVGGVRKGVLAVQEFNLKVTTEPCSSGFMLNVHCYCW